MSFFTIIINHVFEVGPVLGAILEANMADFQSLKADITELKTKVEAETAQSADRERRLADLEAQLAGGLTPAQADELQADIDALKEEIAGIVPDDVPPPPPPEPEPTP